MKISKEQLRRIIQEEIEASVDEGMPLPRQGSIEDVLAQKAVQANFPARGRVNQGIQQQMNSTIKSLIDSAGLAEVNAVSLRAAFEAALKQNGLI